MNTKKKLIVLSMIVICMTIIASGTLAYFTAEDKAHNVITTSGIGIEIIEKTKDENGTEVDFPKEGFSGVMPGSSISKIVSVKNNGGADAWIRVQVEQFIKGADGKELPLKLATENIPVMSFSVDSKYWVDGNDGYYYFAEPVAPEHATEILFEEVHFAGEMGNEYQNCVAQIIVLAQAVQSDNNPIPDGGDVTDIKGWPMEVSE